MSKQFSPLRVTPDKEEDREVIPQRAREDKCHVTTHHARVTEVRDHASPHREEPHRDEPEDKGTDENISMLLASHSVEYLLEEGEGGVHLCMARTQLPASFEVASHGQGSSPSAAKRDASLRLIQNISHFVN